MTDILLIPERLILFEDEGDTTFVEIPGDTAEAEPVKIEIETGLSDGLNIEVVSGLEEGNKVVQRPPRDILG
jgi:HlyD family secretion protein